MPLSDCVGGAVRVRLAGAPVPRPQGAAASERAVVVGHDGSACRVRVVAGARSPDAAGLRPGRGRRSRRSRSGCPGRRRRARRVSHAPDYFARRADGSAAGGGLSAGRSAQAAGRGEVRRDRGGRASWSAGSTGWSARRTPVVVGERAVAGRLPASAPPIARRWPRRCGRCSPTPAPLMAGAEAAGDPIAVLPVLFHLLWRQRAGRWTCRCRCTEAHAGAHGGGRGDGADGRRCCGRVTGCASTAASTRSSALAGTSVRLRSARRRGAGGAGRVPDGLARTSRSLDGEPAAGGGAVRAAGRPARRGAGRRAGVGAARRRGRDRAAAGSAAGRGAAAGVRPGGHDAWRQRDAGEGRRAGRRACAPCRPGGPATPEQGLWGLVDQRAVRQCGGDRPRRRPAGRRDPGGGRRRDRRLDRDPVAADPPGDEDSWRPSTAPGVVPLPGTTTFYKLIDALSRRAGTRSARR